MVCESNIGQSSNQLTTCYTNSIIIESLPPVQLHVGTFAHGTLGHVIEH